MRLWLLLFGLVGFLMAQSELINPSLEQNTTPVLQETSVFQAPDDENQNEYDIGLNENFEQKQDFVEQEETLPEVSTKHLYTPIDFDDSLIVSKQLYAKFLNFPSTVFVHQRVAIKIEALITTQEYTHIQTRFINSENVAVINPQESWKTIGNNKLTNEFFLKIYSDNFELPTFQLILFNEDKIVDVLEMQSSEVRYTNIVTNDIEFCDIIAQSLDVKTVNARQYSNDEILVVLQLEAVNGNLEDFKLKEYEEQFLMSLDESYPKQTLTFNVIVPIYTKTIDFKYYNTQKNKFEKLNSVVQLDEQLISTQTDLNPNNSSMELYKKIAVGVASMLFILIYLFKRDFIYMIIAVVFAGIFFYFAKPNDSIVIHKGTKIYILPTYNSTIFHITQSKQLVEILSKQKEYYKILFQFENQNTRTVGWIKEKDIVEN